MMAWLQWLKQFLPLIGWRRRVVKHLEGDVIDLIEPRAMKVFSETVRELFEGLKIETEARIEFLVSNEDGISAWYNGRCVHHVKKDVLQRLFYNEQFYVMDTMWRTAALQVVKAEQGKI